ncbi:hypothetical protein [Pseudoduganella danionis]|uniref:hypothetical protein n=1 Tax=Pseudoduganella danionis TaxID=1890295 RepID=UPI0035B33639
MNQPACILSQGRWVNTAEAWFGRPAHAGGADLLIARQWPTADWQGKVTEKHTLLIDLTLTPAEWNAAFTKDTQYQVRRADSKDELSFTIETAPDAAAITAYADFYDSFAAQKGLPLCERLYLNQAAAAGVLHLTWASQHGIQLVAHSYIVSQGRARLLHSASQYRASADGAHRSMIGRANRWLHFQDMQALKAAHCSVYDFGGWYAGQTDQQKLQINAFKQEFGGIVTREFDGIMPLTWRGRAYLWLKQLKQRG